MNDGFQTGKFFNNPVPNKKENNSGYLVAIIAFAIMVFGLIALLFGLGIIGHKSDKEYKNEELEEVDSYVKELNLSHKLKDVAMNYSSSWEVEKEDEEQIILSYDNTKVRLLVGTTKYYMTSSRFAEEMVNSYKDEGYNVLSSPSEIDINGITWYKVESIYKGNKTLQLFFAYDYDTYSFTYIAREEDYEKVLAKVVDIYKTLKTDIEIDFSGREEAKEFLEGEWNWGSGGYLVMEDDSFYLYKDSSKSMENVMYGKVSIYDNKIKTYGNGYAEGYYFLGYFDAIVIDGKSKEIGNGNGLELAFTKNSDGTYTAKNINTGFSEAIKKVK